MAFAGQEYAATMRGVGNAEEFEKLANNISPETTPLYSLIGQVDIASDKFEWIVDSLATPAANAIIEAASITAASTAIPTRLYNYAQQLEKTFAISDRQQAIQKKQGGSFDVKQQLQNRTLEVRRDFEYAICVNTARTLGTTGAAQVTGGLGYWLLTSNNSVANVVAGGSARPTETVLLTAMQQQWDDHEPGNMAVLASSTNKLVIDGFSGGAIKNTNVGDKKLTNTVKIYESSFGIFKMITSRYVPNTDIYVLDLDYVKSAILIPIEHVQLGFTKHAEEHMVHMVGGLKVSAINAHAHIASLAA